MRQAEDQSYPPCRRPVTIVHARAPIYRATIVLRHDEAAISSAGLSGELHVSARSGPRRQRRHACRRGRVTVEREPHFGRGRPRRDDLNNAADRVGTIEIAAPAADHVHLLDRRARHTVPIHPATKRIVQRDPVRQHDRTRRTGRRQPAQRGALCRRIGGLRRGTAKQAESRCRPQGIVERGRCRQRQIRRRQNAGRRRRIGDADVSARGRDDDPLVD